MPLEPIAPKLRVACFTQGVRQAPHFSPFQTAPGSPPTPTFSGWGMVGVWSKTEAWSLACAGHIVGAHSMLTASLRCSRLPVFAPHKLLPHLPRSPYTCWPPRGRGEVGADTACPSSVRGHGESLLGRWARTRASLSPRCQSRAPHLLLARRQWRAHPLQSVSGDDGQASRYVSGLALGLAGEPAGGGGAGAVLGDPAPRPQPLRVRDPRPPARVGLGRRPASPRGGSAWGAPAGSPSIPGGDLLCPATHR